MSTRLPSAFSIRMQHLLGEDFPSFEASFEKPRTYGLRLNTDRITPEDFEAVVPFPVERIPWIRNGYFYRGEVRPSRCPLYQAGLYYLQDPGAMTPASRLPILPGDRVLDLCAAPGGKAAAAASLLDGRGLLVANDISASRAKILQRNLESSGVVNALVTCEAPAVLAERFPAWFDKIILDAPCSGEGMFRKEEALLLDWSEEKSRQLSMLQGELIETALSMLRPGGLLMYSTCTYAPEEDEDVILQALERNLDVSLAEIEAGEGFTPGLNGVGVRIYPHRMEAEGHYLALLKKAGEREEFKVSPPPSSEKVPGALAPVQRFFEELCLHTLGGQPLDFSRMELRGEKLYYIPELLAEADVFTQEKAGRKQKKRPAKATASPDDRVRLQGLSFLRCGLYLGDLKKGRFEPSHQLALALHRDELPVSLPLSLEDPRLEAYLRGEQLTLLDEEARKLEGGWQLVTVMGYPLGFGKLVGNQMKNKVPAGWRVRNA